jgi:asparagine synthase (glutamine-hydrolysing)
MCGICGIVHPDPTYPISDSALIEMRDIMEHRGPDDAGHYVGAGVGLGSRRLAILDLSPRGRMPMATPDGRFRIVYNGEVYNYRALRSTLEARGVTFTTNTDTEVILRLFEADGPAMLNRLNGMFAFAIWDSAQRSLFCARDRLGVKPFYYSIHDGAFCFASEQKALLAAKVPGAFDSTTWEELLCFRYVAGERTPYVGVRRLLPGHYLTWRDGRLQITRWWSLAERSRAVGDLPADEAARWFRTTFDDAIRLRRISDVPVGVLLSGGVDSGSVAAATAAQAGAGVASFTMRFTEPEYDEGPVAQLTARKNGLEHRELFVAPAELMSGLRHASWLNDEPIVHASDLHILAIAKYAKNRVTVLLSGEGGDELFGGYVRYRPLVYPALLGVGRHVLAPFDRVLPSGTRLSKLNRFLALGEVNRLALYNNATILPSELAPLGFEAMGQFSYRERVLDEARQLYPNEPVRQAMYGDQHTYLCSLLDRNDRMTMGASIECRPPFLDYRIVEGTAGLPSAVLVGSVGGKRLLRRALGDRLPGEVLRYRKWGFSVPWTRYMQTEPEFRDLIATLADTAPIVDGPFDRHAIRRLTTGFLTGETRCEAHVLRLLTVAIWHQACLGRDRGHRDSRMKVNAVKVDVRKTGAVAEAVSATA